MVAPTRLQNEALVEYSRRRNMALKMFRPMEHQDAFFRDWSREHLLRGGNRSGKSTCAAARFAAVATDTPITLSDGTIVDQRQPWQKGRKLRMWVIGFDGRHIGETIHRLLFQEGLFDIIRDKKTGLNRTFRRWEPEDLARESETKKSPPLIPPRYVKPNSWDWENKKNREFKKVTIINPITKEELADIYAYSSKADPKAGDPVDCIWIDEAIEYPSHYPEWQARLIDNRGCMFWSSWPAVDNDALQGITERAAKEAEAVANGEKEAPLVRESVITLSGNMAMPEDVKKEALGMWASPEERRARDLGEYVTDQLRMYPLYDPEVHQAIYPDKSDDLCETLRETGGMPPANWMRELIIDPGTQHPACLLVAMPPPQFGEYFVVYDEIYPGRADAEQLADLIKEKTGGYAFNRFIIDQNAGRQQGMGYTWRVVDNYIDAFRTRNIRSERTGFEFQYGDNNVGARVGRLQQWMHIKEDGLPKLRIVKARCPKLCDQLRLAKKAYANRDVKDDRHAAGQAVDLVHAIEYWASSSPKYVAPPPGFGPTGDHYNSTLKRLLRMRGKSKRTSHSLGPSYAKPA